MKYQDEFTNLNSKLRETLRPQTEAAIAAARVGFGRARQRLDRLKHSLAAMNEAGRALGQLTGRHAKSFARQNAPLFAAVGNDLSVFARTTLASLQSSEKPLNRVRKAPAKRRRARKSA